MAKFVPNQGNIDRLLDGPSGPVFGAVRRFTNETKRAAKRRVPVDTGLLRRNIKSDEVTLGPLGLHSEVSAYAISERSGENYAYIVHQGRGEIVPVRKPSLNFFWKAKRRRVTMDYVRPRRGRPFLIQGMQDANKAMPPGQKFRITVSKPHRNTGS